MDCWHIPWASKIFTGLSFNWAIETNKLFLLTHTHTHTICQRILILFWDFLSPSFFWGGGVCVCERENITLFYSPDVSRKYIYVWTSFEPTAGESGDQAVVCVPLPIGAKLQEKFLLTQWRDAGTRRWNCPPYCTPHWRWGRKRLRERCQIASKGDHPFWGGVACLFLFDEQVGGPPPPKKSVLSSKQDSLPGVPGRVQLLMWWRWWWWCQNFED